MTLLRAAPELTVLVACEDQALETSLIEALGDGATGLPGEPQFNVTGPDSMDADVLLVEIGGNAGLALFRELRERFPLSALVLCAHETDAELVDGATQHGADDVVFRTQLGPALLRRVVAYAVERNGLSRQLVAAREREAQLATHDSVTGLANRSLLFTCIGQAITFANRQQTGLGVIALDVRHLQRVNESFGYRTGDKVLGVVAERILDAIRTSDMAGRLGGDEFIILLRDISAPGGAGQAVESILREIARPLYVAGHKLSVEARAGIAYFPTDAADAEALTALAHAALNAARAQGSGYVYATAPAMPSLRKTVVSRP